MSVNTFNNADLYLMAPDLYPMAADINSVAADLYSTAADKAFKPTLIIFRT